MQRVGVKVSLCKQRAVGVLVRVSSLILIRVSRHVPRCRSSLAVGFALITPDRTYYCGAETEDIRGMWLTAIRKYLDARGPVDPNAVAKGDAEDDD